MPGLLYVEEYRLILTAAAKLYPVHIIYHLLCHFWYPEMETIPIIMSYTLIKSTAFVVYWSKFLATDPEARVRFPALRERKSSGSGTGSTQPREYN
jgi:hypothetical protein